MTASGFRVSPAVVATTIASLAFLGTGALVARSFVDVKNASDVINVTGSARRSITSDQAVWRFTVQSTDGASLQTAYRNFRATQPAIEAFLKAQALTGAELRREPVNAGPQTYAVYEDVGARRGRYSGRGTWCPRHTGCSPTTSGRCSGQ